MQQFELQVVLEMRYWEGMSMQEIAAVVEFPVNTVKSRIHRGRLRLAELLAR